MDVPHIEGYTDLQVIGRGGFAVVYAARQERLHRRVAVKVLTADAVDERSLRRFERECRAIGELSWHPHVVAVHDSGISDGRLWLAMELFDAGSFAARVRSRGPLPWADAVDAAIQVAGALGAAHAIGTLHRDLKPENMFVGPFGEAKLGDFGIAAVADVSTTTGAASFTMAHVAPEVLRGGTPDERSDLYGLASTLHTLIAGQPPFTLQPGQPVAAAVIPILESPPPRLVHVPAPLADLVLQALAKDPAERPQDAATLGRALQAVQRDEGQAVTPLRLTPNDRSGAAAVDTPPATPEPAPDPYDPDGFDAERTVRLHDSTPVPSAPGSFPAPTPAAAPTPTAAATSTPIAAPPPVTAAPDGPGDPPVAPSAPLVASTASAESPPAGRRRLLIGGLVVGLLVVGVVLALLLGRGDGGDDGSTVPDVTLADLDAGAADVEAYCSDVAAFESGVDTFVSSGAPEDAAALLAESERLTEQFAELTSTSLGANASADLSACADRLSQALAQVTATVESG